MLPAIHPFGIHVPMYGLMAVLGLCAYVVTYFVIVEKIEKVDRTSSNRLLLVSAIGFACLYIFAYLFNSLYHSIEKGKIVWGGITWLGGVLGAFPAILLCIHWLVPKARGNELRHFSHMVTGIVLGHAFGRLGCFLGGCCFGKVTDGPFGVIFPAGSTAALKYPGVDGASLPVYPTQLFEAVFELALFLVMVWGYKKLKEYNVSIYLGAYSVFRFLIEFLRGDDRGSLGAWLSPSQWSCILLLITSVLLVLFQRGLLFRRLNEKCAQWRVTAQKTPTVIMGRHGMDHVAMLRELQKLRDEDIITAEEFQVKKEEILKRI